MARGDVVIAFSEYAADLIAAHRAIPRERIEVIHGCVDVAQFDPEAVAPGRAEALRAAWRIPPTDRVVLAPGRLAGENGQMPLVDAARILVNGGLRHTTFVIAGVPKRRESVARALEKRVVAQGVRPLFRRVGHCADMPALYALADFVVLPLEHMPYFSTTAAEAQAMARPLVVTRTGALPEYVRAPPRDFEGLRTGWIVQPGDPLDLARGLAAALALTPQALGAVSARARALAIAKFSRQHNTGATLAIYARLLDRTTAPIASAQGED